MNKIVYFGSKFYDKQQLSSYNIDYASLNKFRKLFNNGLLYSSGIGLPRLQIPEWYDTIFDLSVPQWQNKSITFEEATNNRALEMMKYYTEDIPILVYWSGGIDSTCVLSAIHKNFNTEFKKRIKVVLTNQSYAENPFFFNKIIKPNYKYITYGDETYINNYVVHGDPGDALWLQGNVLDLSKTRNVTNDNISNDPTNLYYVYKQKGLEDEECDWYINFLKHDAKLIDLELTTTSDYLWWANYSMHVTTSIKSLLHRLPTQDIKNKNFVDAFKNHCLPWFIGNDYQIWSINSQINGKKYNGNIRDYKMPAKQYIYDLDKNRYYRDYKTKCISITNNLKGDLDSPNIIIKQNCSILHN